MTSKSTTKKNRLTDIHCCIHNIKTYATNMRNKNTDIDNDAILSAFVDKVINSANVAVFRINSKLNEINRRKATVKLRRKVAKKVRVITYATPTEISKKFGISRSTVYRLVKYHFTCGKEYIKPSTRKILIDVKRFSRWSTSKK